MTLSKIGAHIIVPTDAARRMARVSPVVKCCDWSAAVLNEAPPGALKIYRAIVPLDVQERMTPAEYLGETLARLGGVHVHAIESRNELRSKISEGLLDRIPWDIEYSRLSHQAGYKVVGGNDANGTMEEPEIKALVANGFCGWDYWATHEYYFDGQPFNGWTCLRYRKYHEWAGGQHPPMLVTEWGPQGKDSGGQGTDGPDLIQRMIDYDAELVRDAYMLGATAFTFGPTQDWIDYGFDFDKRIDDILPLYPTNPTYSLPAWEEPTGGDDMPWDRHAVYDGWARSLGGQGANLDDAFGKAIEQGLVTDVGIFIGGYRGYEDASNPYVYVYTSNGVLYVPKAAATPANVKFARKELELPLA